MTTPVPASPREEERLSAAVRVNVSPGELVRLQAMAVAEDRPVAAVVRRAVREMFARIDQVPA